MSRTLTPAAAIDSEDRHEALDNERSEAERQLVDEDHRRAGHEGLGEHDHLLLPTRQRTCRRVPPLLQLGEQLERVLGALLGRVAVEHVRRHPKVVGDGELGQQAAAFGNDGEAGLANLFGTTTGEVAVAERHRARGRANRAGDSEYQRRLAGAVRSEQGGDLPRCHIDRHVAEHRPPTTRDAQPVDAECLGRTHATSSVPR